MKKASFQYIDDCFRNIKYGKDMTQSFVSIVNTLKREFNIKVSIDIVKNTSNVFFGMNIYPSINDLRRIADLMISDKTRSEEFIHSWNEIEEWCIEIDSLLFDDLGFDIEAGELTALLLHEIGHVIFSDEVPKTTLKVVKFNVLKRELMFRNLFKEGNVNGLIMSFPIIEACSNKSFSKKSLNNELNADEFVRKCGYGKELYTLIDKLIVNGQNSMVNKHIKEKEQDISIITNWSLDNINSFVYDESTETCKPCNGFISFRYTCDCIYKNSLLDARKTRYDEKNVAMGSYALTCYYSINIKFKNLNMRKSNIIMNWDITKKTISSSFFPLEQ